MSDEKADWLSEDKDIYNTCPPPPYVSDSGSDDDTRRQHNGITAQRQGDCMSRKGCSSTWWRRALRRVLVPSHKVSQQQARDNDKEPTTAPIPPKGDGNVIIDDLEFPRWYKHNGMTCGHGATSTKLPLPVAPPPYPHRYSLDVLCCPSPQVPESAARWQQARLLLSSDHLPELLRGPPIPWRANIDDCCYIDEVRFVNYPYPVPFFTVQPESRTAIVKAYYHNNTASTPCGISMSVGGHTYERTIKLSLLRDRPDSGYWCFALSLTSRDGDWLASLSRADAAALVSLDSAIRAVGWIHPERDPIKNSVMFYAKAFWRPWVEATDLEPREHGKPWYIPSPLGVAHDEEVRQLVDDTIEKLIRGGDE
ncbi:hypothetical protein B0T25DRAFT_559861 [Lasiosphaeria hispida]|uniref:Uncharacterized protein n=1 Tax=Lasiosphaeria hispida TaxID=260671 RepID=A0AAJ0H7F7_9PEZI|nr:hypothetical protein B0T25DRAFT_559861 [Lasiosphaeria hispida]